MVRSGSAMQPSSPHSNEGQSNSDEDKDEEQERAYYLNAKKKVEVPWYQVPKAERIRGVVDRFDA